MLLNKEEKKKSRFIRKPFEKEKKRILDFIYIYIYKIGEKKRGKTRIRLACW